MKEKIFEQFRKLVSDRYFFGLVIFMLLQATILSIVLGLSIHTNDRQLVSHYSAFGETHFYFGQWSYLFVFVVFGFMVSIMNSIIALKLYQIKGRSMAFTFVWFGIAVVFMGWIIASKILNLQALL